MRMRSKSLESSFIVLNYSSLNQTGPGMSTRDTIIEKLTQQFSPTHLEVIDESYRHQGHAGWRQEGETHFRVRIATRQFDGKVRLAQHRAVMAALDPELKAGVHALAIEIVVPDAPTPPSDPVEKPEISHRR
jgi:BolA protein